MTTDVITEPKPTFAIDTLDRLAWFGRKVSAKQAEIDTLDASYKALRAELVKDLDAFRWWFQPQAERFVRDHLTASGGRSKTLRTLGGAFCLRTVPAAIRKTEDQVLVAWAQNSAPELVRETIKHDVPADGLKRYWQSTGEVPPGCEIVPEHETFNHKIEKAGPTGQGDDHED
jgi:hypothetical protein